MKYISTRGHSDRLTAAEAIIAGIAPDGGLYVPTEIPKVSAEFVAALAPLSYSERAEKILALFLTDYSAAEIAQAVSRAYGGGKFDDAKIAPVKEIGGRQVLELWHGPTSAFKDMALQLLPQLLSIALKKTGETDEVLILVATSGDTGKAALAGFADVPQTKICVFYPDGGVSEIQRLQMVTQAGGNVRVLAVRGNFDDAQNGVKAIFGDAATAATLKKSGVRLSSANSINWGRLVPQIVYYFSAYADLLAGGAIENGDAVDYCVPTGNFGNILAAYYAKEMGLPVGRLVCASNKNDVLTEFLTTGRYDKRREFYKTISPSMDILISSNLERLLYHLTGSAEQTAALMAALSQNGYYVAGESLKEKIAALFAAGSADDARTKATIKEVFAKTGYVLDTHTAVAWAVAADYQAAQPADCRRPLVVVSTASPYKFSQSVLEALGENTDGKGAFDLLAALAAKNPTPAPVNLASLNGKKILHNRVVEKAAMEQAVCDFAAGK